jgi:hypothetical protein
VLKPLRDTRELLELEERLVRLSGMAWPALAPFTFGEWLTGAEKPVKP